MKKRVLRTAALLLTLLAVLLCFGSCGNGSAIAENIETSPIPDGMAFGDLCGILSIYGHKVEMPCTADDITALDERITRDPQFGSQLSFATNAKASSMYSTGSDVIGSSYYKSVTLTASDEIHKTDLFTLNGDIKFGSDISAIRGLLGEPNEECHDLSVKGDTTLKYAFIEGDDVLRLWFGSDGGGEIEFFLIMHTKWTKV